jgi:hypothetical protein
VAAGGREHEAGTPRAGKESDGADGEEAGEGRLPRVLRRQGGPVHREAGTQVPDVVHRRVPRRQDAHGRPLPPAHPGSRGRRPLPLPDALPRALQLLPVTAAFLPTPRHADR